MKPMDKQLISVEAQKRLIEGARKGGSAPKHYTPETKEKQRDGARRGGMAPKHFTPDSKARQIEGARKGGQSSHRTENANLNSME